MPINMQHKETYKQHLECIIYLYVATFTTYRTAQLYKPKELSSVPDPVILEGKSNSAPESKGYFSFHDRDEK